MTVSVCMYLLLSQHTLTVRDSVSACVIMSVSMRLCQFEYVTVCVCVIKVHWHVQRKQDFVSFL